MSGGGRAVSVAGDNPTTRPLADSQRGGKGAVNGSPRRAITSRIRSG